MNDTRPQPHMPRMDVTGAPIRNPYVATIGTTIECPICSRLLDCAESGDLVCFTDNIIVRCSYPPALPIVKPVAGKDYDRNPFVPLEPPNGSYPQPNVYLELARAQETAPTLEHAASDALYFLEMLAYYTDDVGQVKLSSAFDPTPFAESLRAALAAHAARERTNNIDELRAAFQRQLQDKQDALDFCYAALDAWHKLYPYEQSPLQTNPNQEIKLTQPREVNLMDLSAKAIQLAHHYMNIVEQQDEGNFNNGYTPTELDAIRTRAHNQFNAALLECNVDVSQRGDTTELARRIRDWIPE